MQVFIAFPFLLAVASASWGHQAWGNHGWANQHVPVIANGVPVDTPEVQHAKAAHFAAVAEAQAQHGHAGYDSGAWAEPAAAPWAASPWAHAQHVPVIANGVPVDTPEVQHARAAHLAAVAEAQATHGHAGYGAAPWAAPAASWAAPAASWAAPAASWGAGYGAHVAAGGLPLDTPEVAHAKAAHFAAHAEANARNAHSAHAW